jgi:uncharacterized protein (DUF1697 family)
MMSFVALLRGINVGGHNKLPMAEFRALLSTLGGEDVATCIQSGNAVFRHHKSVAELSLLISDALKTRFGFDISVMVLTSSEFGAIATANPFAAAESEPKSLHIWFLRERATNANTECMDEIAAESEAFQLTDSAFYLHAPDGIGRSKLASNVEKCLAVPATARNWRTLGKIGVLLEALNQ